MQSEEDQIIHFNDLISVLDNLHTYVYKDISI